MPILYMATSGCQWRMLPRDFPPRSTVQGYFYDWTYTGLVDTINHLLVLNTRELEGREPSPTAGVIDSQSVKPRKVAVFAVMTPERRSRAATSTSLTDTIGLMLFVIVHAQPTFRIATSACDLVKAIRYRFPWLASSFCRWRLCRPETARGALRHGEWNIEIIKRCDTAKGFVVSSTPMGGGTNLCMAWTLPTAGKRLGT